MPKSGKRYTSVLITVLIAVLLTTAIALSTYLAHQGATNNSCINGFSTQPRPVQPFPTRAWK